MSRQRQIDLWLGDREALERLLAKWPMVDGIDTSNTDRCLQAFARGRPAYLRTKDIAMPDATPRGRAALTAR